MHKHRLFSLFVLSWIIIAALVSPLQGQEMSQEEVASTLQNIKKCGIVLRVPTNSKKLDYLKQILKDDDLTEKRRKSILKSIEETENENISYLNILREGIENDFAYANVFYVPDTLYKRMVNGSKFIYYDYTVKKVVNDSNGCLPLLAILPANDKDELEMYYLDGRKVGKPLPFQKSTFLSVFKKIFSRKNYIQDQIKWFDDQLNALYAADPK